MTKTDNEYTGKEPVLEFTYKEAILIQYGQALQKRTYLLARIKKIEKVLSNYFHPEDMVIAIQKKTKKETQLKGVYEEIEYLKTQIKFEANYTRNNKSS